MSYILEALKKSEREGQRGTQASASAPPPANRSHPRRWLLAALVAALLINAAILGLRAWETIPAERGISAQTNTRPAAKPSPASSPRETAPATVPGRGRAGHSAEPDAGHPAPATAPAHADTGAVQVKEPPGAIQPPPKPKSARAMTSVNPAPRAAPPSGNVVAFSQLPESFKQSLPSLTINVHVYADNPAKRFVLINMHRYTEGQRLKEGPRLVSITPDGVLLSFKGRRFRISAQ